MFSPASQTPFPQTAGHVPQSWQQVEHVSVPLHTLSPHTGCVVVVVLDVVVVVVLVEVVEDVVVLVVSVVDVDVLVVVDTVVLVVLVDSVLLVVVSVVVVVVVVAHPESVQASQQLGTTPTQALPPAGARQRAR